MATAKIKILIIGSSEERALALGSMLPGRHYAVSCVSASRDALRASLGGAFALVLLEVGSSNGPETATLIRSYPRHADIPIIFLTACRPGAGETRRLFSLPRVDLLAEPFAPEVLLVKVEIFAQLHRQGLALAAKSRQLVAAGLELAEAQRRLQEHSRELEESRLAQTALGTDLAQASRSARRAVEARSHLLSNLSHQIRTPLTGMLGMIDFTLDSDLRPDQTCQLEIARKAGKALVRVISDLLDFARIEAGHLQLVPAPFDVRDTIAGILRLSGREAERKGLNLWQSGSDAVPELILADEHRIRQILSNLVENSVKFTQKGSVEVQAHFSEDYAGKYLRLAVCDSGVGISQAAQLELFETRAEHAPGASSYGASGFGLALCAKLVGLMGGEIACQSTRGRGSTFTVTLPVAVPLLSFAPAGSGSLQNGGLTVLIAEDDPIILEVMTRLTSRAGHRVLTAQDGREAFRVWERERPHVVLMDVKMPDLDGLEATRRIREREKQAGGGVPVPIYGLTAHVRDEDVTRCLGAGMTGHIGKPIDFPCVLEILQRHQDRGGSPAAASTTREATRHEQIQSTACHRVAPVAGAGSGPREL
jgi:two-component system, sensor histidine kinase